MIRFDTLIRDLERQYEYVVPSPYETLGMFDDSNCASMTLASSFIHSEFGRS